MNTSNSKSRTEQRAERDLLKALELAMAVPASRVLVRWILEQCGLFEPSFTGNSETFYKEGRRSIGLEIIAALNKVDPYEVVRLMKEGADKTVELRNKDRKDVKNDD